MEIKPYSKIQIEFCDPRALLHCSGLNELARIVGVSGLMADGFSDQGLPIASALSQVEPHILQSILKINEPLSLDVKLGEVKAVQLSGFDALLNALSPGTYPCAHGSWTCPEGYKFRIEAIGIDPNKET
ncbi:hypothetical protein GF362_04660 [Candidatus Dojkabacteria bacterium]|nr:hypothetical protein [Candidatus Dojkabacteria bacterium]